MNTMNKMKRTEFYEQVVMDIPRGKVSTYGQIAFLLGCPQSPRMVGQALHHAPSGRGLPCHRVVNSKGRLVPYWSEQKELLLEEGIAFKKDGCVDIKAHLWNFYEDAI